MNIDTLLMSSDAFISATAKMAVEYKKALEQRVISQAEYDELIGDLTDLKRIDQYAVSIERQVLIQEAFQCIKEIATIIV